MQANNKLDGYALLSKIGKKVLRPGGMKLTLRLLDELQIKYGDDVVEFAPGRGATAALALQRDPHSYIGIDTDAKAVLKLSRKFKGRNIQFIQASAAHTDIPARVKDCVFGEAMLTMQADHRKIEIIKEAIRILRKGGLYGIHELALLPETIEEDLKADIQKSLAKSVMTNTRPLTVMEWKALLEAQGLKIRKVILEPMGLLRPLNILKDEGYWGTLRIAANVLTHSEIRKRVQSMRQLFCKYHQNLTAVAIVAEKVNHV
ncbi:MAG: methyltransferase domain-containing protein [Bacteroidetes bacterium]|nr:methyltransferase domain-containing protein [Bacteroidota bacterium]MBS1740220.1 methyltransferase domain-containing protein [Bacteroidota bacterium]